MEEVRIFCGTLFTPGQGNFNVYFIPNVSIFVQYFPYLSDRNVLFDFYLLSQSLHPVAIRTMSRIAAIFSFGGGGNLAGSLGVIPITVAISTMSRIAAITSVGGAGNEVVRSWSSEIFSFRKPGSVLLYSVSNRASHLRAGSSPLLVVVPQIYAHAGLLYPSAPTLDYDSTFTYGHSSRPRYARGIRRRRAKDLALV